MRGQATVELALGALVFVTVLLLAIAFAEVGFLSTKVHEAATTALWDTTARPMHRHPNGYEPRREAVARAGPDATELYRNFDGRASAPPSGRRTLALATGRDLRVECTFDRLLDTSRARRPPFPGGEGGMRCQASARAEFSGLPPGFAEDERGFFRRPLLDRAALPLCAQGRPQNGSCGGSSYALLLDTWALTGERESGLCSMEPQRCRNRPYRALVEDLYDHYERRAGSRGQAEGFAREVVGAAPGQSPREFRFSFWESSKDPGYHPGDDDPTVQGWPWMTTVRGGSRNTRYLDRANTFLGEPRDAWLFRRQPR